MVYGMNRPVPEAPTPSNPSGVLNTPSPQHPPAPPPRVPDHELLRRIGGGSYGEVWLARNKLGTLRAIKIVYRSTFEDARPFEREFKGIQKFEPISRSHEGLVDILQVGGTEEYFYYVMELADDAGGNQKSEIRNQKEDRNPKPETRNPKELRTPDSERATEDQPVRDSDFGIASGFGIRNSELYTPSTLR